MRRTLIGLGAAFLLLLLLVGLPVLLVAIWPVGLPHIAPTPAGLWAALFRPDDGTLFLTLVKIAGWIVWALMLLTVLAEAVGRLRHMTPIRLPGLALPQGVARGLVAATIALFINTNTALSGPPAPTAQAAPLNPAPAAAPVQPSGLHDDRAAAGYERYTVKKGDILSQIALDHLGNARRYPEIYRASRGIDQPGGRHLTDPDVIDIGWKLNLPSKRVDAERERTPEKPHKPTAEAPPPTRATPGPSAPAPASTEPSASTSGATNQSGQVQAEDDVERDGYRPDWLLTGLAGAGALLAGSLWLILTRRRAIQHHHRRPGFATAPPPPSTVPVEKTLRYQGQPIADLVTFVDETLRRLAATVLQSTARLPRVLAVEVARSSLTVHLADETTLAEPWQRYDEGKNSWTITTADDPNAIGDLRPDGPAPWPHLTTIGADDTGHFWLLNLEQFGTVTITGDDDYAHDLARYIAAEVASCPWSRDLEIDLIGVFHEIIGLSPSRCHHHADRSGLEDAVAAAVEMADRLNRTNGADTPTARIQQADEELWLSRMVVAQQDQSGMLDQLTGLVETMPLRTATAVLVIDPKGARHSGTELIATADGRLRVPALGLDLVGNGVTADEARGAVQLLRAADDLTGADVPAAPSVDGEPWREFSDAAGRLRDELTEPRNPAGARSPDETNLPEPDELVTASAATTGADLAVLAPKVKSDLRSNIEQSDPTLDADLEAWFGPQAHRPKLAVLGRMKVRVAAGQENDDTRRRRPYYTELVAYLASRPNGATTQELCKAFGAGGDRIRRDLATVRKWLGQDPATGKPYLPGAVQRPASNGRTTGHYQLSGILYDADLFRRLRVRGQARGENGIDDFMRALDLVDGRPYDDLREGGGIWLTGDREDQNLLVAIVDTAHLAATMAMQTKDYATATLAAEIAHAAAPAEDSPRLDLAKAAAAMGEVDRSAEVFRDLTSQGDAEGPVPLDHRTRTLLALHGGPTRTDETSETR